MTTTHPRPLDGVDAARVDPTTVSARLTHITPNWFTSVMGTGIVATSASTLPVHVRCLHTVATMIWVLAGVAFVVVIAAFIAHWVLHRDSARGYLDHPVVSHFYGAPAMAAMTVGAGTLLFGTNLVGIRAAVLLDAALWTTGTVVGLVVIVSVIARSATRPDRGGPAVPARMMSVVAPMVSASTGALLVPHIADAGLRSVFLVSCYALFGISLVVGTATALFVYRRMIRVGPPADIAAPTAWIPLGMIGQSITAAITLGAISRGEFTGSRTYIADALHVAGVAYGIGAALVGLAVAATALCITARAARRGLPFSLSWWSFTFPVGTCVTGATALGTATGIGDIHLAAVGLFVALVTAWAVVAVRTIGAIGSGALPTAA